MDGARHPTLRTIAEVRDGGIYDVQPLSLVQTNLFIKVGRIGELFIKVPSGRGISDYLQFVKLAQPCPEDVRSVETAERFEVLDATLEALPALKPLKAISPEFTHYLVVHKLQYERLRSQTAVEIPAARFGFLQSSERGLVQEYEPAMFQERVRGATLWSMFDFAEGRVLRQWQLLLPTISAQLSELLDTGLTKHIDWNIKNFIVSDEERLFYVDLKPTTFVAKRSNEQNLKGICNYFLR